MNEGKRSYDLVALLKSLIKGALISPKSYKIPLFCMLAVTLNHQL